MLIAPEFELGLWNAWIVVLSFLLLFIVGGIFDRLKGQKGSSRPDKPPFNEKEEKIFGISQLAIWASNIYSIFLPLKLGTAWFSAWSPPWLLTAWATWAKNQIDEQLSWRLKANARRRTRLQCPASIGESRSTSSSRSFS